jgi:hypothetical protein
MPQLGHSRPGEPLSPTIYCPLSKATSLLRAREMTRRAMCGRLRIGKDFLHACSIGRSSHVFGLFAGLHDRWP